MIFHKDSKAASGYGRQPFARALVVFAVLAVSWLQMAHYRRDVTKSSSSSSLSMTVPLLDLDRKKGSTVIMNIGSNKSPIGPRL